MHRTRGKKLLLYALHARAVQTLIWLHLKKTKKQSTEKSLFIYSRGYKGNIRERFC
jgi:hypothetical protein